MSAMIDPRDVRIDYGWSYQPIVRLKMTHYPTGIMIEGAPVERRSPAFRAEIERMQAELQGRVDEASSAKRAG